MVSCAILYVDMEARTVGEAAMAKNVSPETDRLRRSARGALSASEPEMTFQQMPHAETSDGDEEHPVWRVRFDLPSSGPEASFGLDINGEVILGRGRETTSLVDLSPHDAVALGVSRHHLILRPTTSKLFVIDAGSTNGTLKNGRSMGRNTPYSLSHGDTLLLGNLELAVSIIKRPPVRVATILEKADLADILSKLAEAITSELKLDDVLSQALEMAMALVSAGEAAIWLVDEGTGELFLEAERGIQDEEIRRLRLPVTDTLAGKVITTGKPIRVSRTPDGKRVKLKTGYKVEAVLYVPLTLGGVTFGVLAAAHREPKRIFSKRDEDLLMAVGRFAAIAIQNSRLHESTDKALTQRVAELAAVNELLQAVTSSLDLDRIYTILVARLHKRWDFETVGLWLVDEQRQSIEPLKQSLQEDDDDITHMSFKLGEGILGRVAHTGEPALIQDIETSTKIDDKETTLRLAARPAACVPLVFNDKVVGLLALFGKKTGAFTQDDLNRLQTIVHPVAATIQNARLFAQIEQEQAAVRHMARMLSEPLMVISREGKLILSNQAADDLLETVRQHGESKPIKGGTRHQPLAQLLGGLRQSVGQPKEITVGAKTYVATVEHAEKVGTIIVMLDITDERTLERLRTEFAQALSHDIRGPLGSIRGYARLLKDPRVSRSQRDEMLDDIFGASDRMITMANQLLDFALLCESPVAGHTSCDPMGVVTNAVSDMRGMAHSKSIKLDFEAGGSPYEIEVDASRLHRSTLNLIENAIKHSPEGSQVSVKLTFDEREVTLTVRDSGPGIPEDELDRIFEKYYRVKDMPEGQPSIGLGLAMVKATVEAYQGKVHARNIKGNGAEFVIRLPSEPRQTS